MIGRFCLALASALTLALSGAAIAQTAPLTASPAAAVQGLFLLSDARSRSIGPENLTGRPGMGGRRALKDGSAKYAAKDLGTAGRSIPTSSCRRARRSRSATPRARA